MPERRLRAAQVLVAALLSSFLLSGAAEPPTARYAGAQLGVAAALLEQSRAALALGEYERARALAAQAALDARLAWSMTDSHAVRRAAVEIGLAAEAARRKAVLTARF